MSDVVIFFGSGASYGAGGVEPPPPLGTNLFERLSKEFPDTWGKLPSELSDRFKENFELGMETLYETTEDVAGYLKDMTIFFSKFKITNLRDNLYWGLVERYKNELESDKMILATINYECLIELATLYFNPNITYWGENKGIKILKLHGSCNFIKSGISGKGRFILAKGIVKGGLRLVHPTDVEKEMSDNPLPAAMSLYARGKKVIIAPDQINQIIEEFHEAVHSAIVVVIIGVRPNPDDHHIWDHIRDMDAELVLIGNESECISWIDQNRVGKKSIWLSDTFNSGFEELCELLNKSLYDSNEGKTSFQYSFIINRA